MSSYTTRIHQQLQSLYSSLKKFEKKTWGGSLIAIGGIALGIISLLAVNHQINCHLLTTLGNYGGGGSIGVGMLTGLVALSREYRRQAGENVLTEMTDQPEKFDLEVAFECPVTAEAQSVWAKYQDKITSLLDAFHEEDNADHQEGKDLFTHRVFIRTEEKYIFYATIYLGQPKVEISQDHQWNFYNQILIANVEKEEFLEFIKSHKSAFTHYVSQFEENKPLNLPSHRYMSLQFGEKVVVLKEEENGLRTLWLYDQDDQCYRECLDDLGLNVEYSKTMRA